MSVQVFKWTDVGAPALSGQPGALISVLTYILEASGWTVAFRSGPYRRAYRQGGGFRRYYQVNDDANTISGSGSGGKDAAVVGFETMTAYDVGTGRFPNFLPINPSNTYTEIRKSNSTGEAGRSWCGIADDRTCWLFTEPGDVVGRWFGYMLGDIDSFIPKDPYAAAICGGHSFDQFGAATLSWLEEMPSSYFSGARGKWATRPATGVPHGRHQNLAHQGAGVLGLPAWSSGGNPADGRLYISPAMLTEGDQGAGLSFVSGSTLVTRGRFRGLWVFHHKTPWPNAFDTFGGTRELTGRTFTVIPGWFVLFVIETSNTWDQRP